MKVMSLKYDFCIKEVTPIFGAENEIVRKHFISAVAKMFTADLRRGKAYKKAKKCIAITILDFNLDEREAYHNKYLLRDDDGKVYTDILELHAIELKKNPNKEQPTPLDEWHSLFNAKTEEDLDMKNSVQKIRVLWKRLMN